jgi:ribosomal protein S18 acetylase RimI-like enzyme
MFLALTLALAVIFGAAGGGLFVEAFVGVNPSSLTPQKSATPALEVVSSRVGEERRAGYSRNRWERLLGWRAAGYLPRAANSVLLCAISYSLLGRLLLSCRFKVEEVGRRDLDEASQLCVRVFFGREDTPWKAAQLRQLYSEQYGDLKSRCMKVRENIMFKMVDTMCVTTLGLLLYGSFFSPLFSSHFSLSDCNQMVGFVEVGAQPGTKYGMGESVPELDIRPVISNLAVDPEWRRCGLGSELVAACEETVRQWGYDEMVLQVEEDNESAIRFYERLGFAQLFVDRAARRYDTSGFLLTNVRTSKVTMRKQIASVAAPHAKGIFWALESFFRPVFGGGGGTTWTDGSLDIM